MKTLKKKINKFKKLSYLIYQIYNIPIVYESNRFQWTSPNMCDLNPYQYKDLNLRNGFYGASINYGDNLYQSLFGVAVTTDQLDGTYKDSGSIVVIGEDSIIEEVYKNDVGVLFVNELIYVSRLSVIYPKLRLDIMESNIMIEGKDVFTLRHNESREDSKVIKDLQSQEWVCYG